MEKLKIVKTRFNHNNEDLFSFSSLVFKSDDWGKKISSVYTLEYISGSPVFDKYLNGKFFYETSNRILVLTNIAKDTLYFALVADGEVKCIEHIKIIDITDIGYDEIEIMVAKRDKTGPSFLSESPFILPMLAGAVVDLIKTTKKSIRLETIQNEKVKASVYEMQLRSGRVFKLAYANIAQNPFFSFFNKNIRKLTMPKGRGNCYIATVCYENALAPQVMEFQNFRDNILNKYSLGRLFIKSYYKYSPSLAQKIKSRPLLNKFIRTKILDTVYFLIKANKK